MSSPAIQPLRLRVAEPSDVEARTRLINAAFLVERFFIEGDRINAETVRRMMGTGQFVVAQDEDGIAACVYLEPRGERAYLGLLSVDPARQRSGLGSRMITAAEDHARALGAGHIDLRIVNLREELPAFYRRLGYLVTGTSPFPPDVIPKQPCHFVNMSKPLPSS
jgi:predicted N-acetyltransferase YhbS